MSWPLSHEFNEAVQNPSVVFSDPDLKGGETVVGATGLPLPRSGNFADVYQLRGADGREWAVKCFTRPVTGLAERYAKVSEALAGANLPFAVGFTFLPEGIRVGGAWRPVVKMEWVEGLLLNQMVRENAGSAKVLSALGQMWVKLCKRLREASVAHADLQHGNVMLVPGSRAGAYGLKLIDYDGMWVPALANTPSGEVGHPSYQHPMRAANRTYSSDVDRFPHLVVATALRGLLVGGSSLWEKYDNGDNLLFTEVDYKKPAESKLMKELWQTGDAAVQALVGRLAIACGKPIPQTPWLDQFAPEGDPAPLDDATQREAVAALGLMGGVAVAADWAPVPVPLPPEPGVEVEEPEPAFALPAKPRKPVVVRRAGESDPEEESVARTRRPAKERPKKGVPVAAWIAAGALAVCAVVVIVVAAQPKSEPAGRAKAEPEPIKAPEPTKQPDPPAPKPKDPAPPKPKDTTPPKPKDKDGDKKGKEKEPDPKPKEPPPLGPVLLDKPVWSVAANSDGVSAAVQIVDQTVLWGSSRTHTRAADLQTGAEHPQFDRNLTGGDAFSGLNRGLVAKYAPDDSHVRTWDVMSGKPAEKHAVPNVPDGAGEAKHKLAWLAPNGKYIAVARGASKPGTHPAVPFRVFATDKGGKAVLDDLSWTGGTVHFIENPARVLVAEYAGRFRWFDLAGDLNPPGRKNFTPPPEGQNHVVTDVSANGEVIGYNGPAHGSSAAPHLLDGKGNVLLRFGSEYLPGSPVVVSADGRRAAVLRKPVGGTITIEVVAATSRGDAIARATVTAGTELRFALSDDAQVLVVHNPKPGTLERFDLPP